MSTIVKLTVLLHQPGKLNDRPCLSFICDEAQYQPTSTTKSGGGGGGWLTLDLCKIIKCLHGGLAQELDFNSLVGFCIKSMCKYGIMYGP